jgi:predicted acetyltransferase
MLKEDFNAGEITMSWKDEILKFNEKFGTDEENLETALKILNKAHEDFREVLRDENVPSEVKDQIMTPMLDIHKAAKYVESVHLNLKYGNN